VSSGGVVCGEPVAVGKLFVVGGAVGETAWRIPTSLFASFRRAVLPVRGRGCGRRSRRGRQARPTARTRPTASRRRTTACSALDALVVSSHAHAGLLAFNLADRSKARRYFVLARDVADDAGDDTLRAQTLVGRRILYTSIESGGRGSASGGLSR
jgi:hypothetical protein